MHKHNIVTGYGPPAFARETSLQQTRDRAEDPEALLAQAIEFESFCFDAVKAEGVTLAAHLRRGSR